MNNSEQGKSKEEIIDDILEGYESHRVMTDADYYEYLWDKGSISQAMEDYVKAVSPPPQPLGIDELNLLKRKLEFYREQTDKVRELVFIRNDIGEPCQPLYDAIVDKITSQEKEIELLKAGYAAPQQSTSEEEKELMRTALEKYSSPYGKVNAETKAFVEGVKYKSVRIGQLESGIKQFLIWLKEKRPSMSGHGAPIMILEDLLNNKTNDLIKFSTSEDECQHPFREVSHKGVTFYCNKCKQYF